MSPVRDGWNPSDDWNCCADCGRIGPDVVAVDADTLVCSDCDLVAWEEHYWRIASNDQGASLAGPRGRRLAMTRLDAVRPVATRWLWRDRIPLGSSTILVGREGLGKSTLTAGIAAKVTTGTLDGDLIGESADVLVISYEDHLASTITPRLAAAGADLGRVHVLGVTHDGAEDMLSFPDDLDLIEEATLSSGAKLLVVDPIVAALSGKIDGHKDQHVRRVLAPIAKLAERLDLAALAIMHFNKGASTDVAMRINGSIGFAAAARSVLAFGLDPNDPEGEEGSGRVLAVAKANLARKAPSLAYRLEEAKIANLVLTSRLVEIGECDATASSLLSPRGADRSERDTAKEWLADELADGEWHTSRELHAASGAAGISSRTLQRAGKDLGVEVAPHGFPARSHWRLAVAPGANGATGGVTVGTRIPTGDSADSDSSRATQEQWRDCGADDELARLRAKGLIDPDDEEGDR